ncbi:MAG: hypothetical protein KDC34_14520 [Saprospiraceae bacterium]|nr:hypothetical protein [Saprospiraceae bacterium]
MKNLLSIIAVAAFGLFFNSCQKEELILAESTRMASTFGTSEIQGPDKPYQGRFLSHARVLVSSNTTGIISEYFYAADEPMSVASSYTVSHADADGIVYDPMTDALYQVNRSNNQLVAFAEFGQAMNGGNLTPSAVSSSDFINGREAAFGKGRVVVAQDASPDNGDQNAFVIYRTSPGQIQYAATVNTDINLWGIQVVDSDLWAVVDNSNMLAYFEKFTRLGSGFVNASSTVMIEGIVRTHGLNYNQESDIMILTDVGDATSATDGAIHVITDFSSKWMEAVNGSGMISLEDQIRISGPMSLLGNPVDVDYNYQAEKIYVAERANAGGQFLTFDLPTTSGDATPVEAILTPGASAVTIGNE